MFAKEVDELVELLGAVVEGEKVAANRLAEGASFPPVDLRGTTQLEVSARGTHESGRRMYINIAIYA